MPSIRRATSFSAVLFFLALAPSAFADGRFALLIGNKNYTNLKLTSPHTDVELVRQALLRSGFQKQNIEVVHDANVIDLPQAVSRFSQKLRAGGPDALGFFYYSGHGAASSGGLGEPASNYIIPIGADESGPMEVFSRSVKLTNLIAILRNGAPLADLMIIFDACRSELNLRAQDSKTFVVEPFDARGSDVFFGFSTSPGAVAYDGNERGSPFAIALSEELDRAGQHHEDVFYNVRIAVREATKNRPIPQVPWYDPRFFRKRIYFLQRPLPDDPQEVAHWHYVLAANSIEGYEDYIKRYPNSPRRKEAQQKIFDKQEEQAWFTASANPTRAAFEHFRALYPFSKFVPDAQRYLQAYDMAEEDRDFREAKISRSEDKLLDFVRKYPNSRRRDEVSAEIKKLREEEGRAKRDTLEEKKAFESALFTDRIPGYVTYLALFGDSANAPTAQRRLKLLNESRDWLRVADTRSVAGIESFLQAYPEGNFAEDARSLLAALSVQEIIPSESSPAADSQRRNLFFPRASFSHFGGKIIDRLDLRKAQPIRRLVLTNDLSQLYSGGDDGSVRIWDLDGVRNSERLAPAHTQRIYALAKSNNSRFMASGAWDRQVFLWDSHSNQHVAAIPVRPRIYSMAFSPTGRWIAAAGSSGQVDFIHVQRQQIVNRRQIASARRIHAIAYLPNRSEDLVVGDASGALRLWTVRRGSERHVAGAHRGDILAIVVDSKGSLIASAGLDRSIKFWSETLNSIATIPNAHRKYITALRFTPDGRYLASGGADFLIRIWDTKTFSLVRGPFVGHLGDVETIEFSPDGKYMFSSSEDKSIKIWDVDENRLLYTLVGFPNGGYIIFDQQGRYLASQDIDSILKSGVLSHAVP